MGLPCNVQLYLVFYILKVRNFEAGLASALISEVEKELPPDWNSSLLSSDNSVKTTNVNCQENESGRLRPIYAKPFSWKKTEPLIDLVSLLPFMLLTLKIVMPCTKLE